MIWSLYTAISGQAIPSAFGLFSLAATVYNPVEITKDISGPILTIDPVNDLGYGTCYTVKVPAYSVIDSVYNGEFESDYSFSFTTKDKVVDNGTNLALGKAYAKSEAPDGSYPDSNNESTDGILAGNYSDGKSYGYRVAVGETKSVDVTIDLSVSAAVYGVKVYKWEGWGNYGPNVVAVSTSQDGVNFQVGASTDTPTGQWYAMSLPSNINARYVKVNFSKTNNGASEWLFIDEIQVIGISVPGT